MEVDFYQTATGKNVIEKFLDGLPDKEVAKVLREIDLLAEYGLDLREPHTKHLEGPIWELRIRFSSNIHRILYFIWRENKIVLLHGFTKKTQKTPASEIETAKRHLNDYVLRYNNAAKRGVDHEFK